MYLGYAPLGSLLAGPGAPAAQVMKLVGHALGLWSLGRRAWIRI